jgi:hypothetical protein
MPVWEDTKEIDWEGQLSMMAKKTAGYVIDHSRAIVSLAATGSIPPICKDHISGLWTIPRGCIVEIRKLRGGYEK